MYEHKAFNKRVDEVIDGEVTEERKTRLTRVFYGATSREQLSASPPSEEMWDESVVALDEALRFLARRIRENRNLYNATKHGLAVLSEPMGMRFENAEANELFNRSGPGLRFLERRDNSDGNLHWYESAAWVDVTKTILAIHRAIALIEQLWAVARKFYLGDLSGAVTFIRPEHVKALLPDANIVVDGMQMELLYYAQTD